MTSLSAFREGDQGASNLAWSSQTQSWLCGDSSGSLLTKAQGQDEHTVVSLQGDQPITAIAVHPISQECAVAENDTVCVRSLTSLDTAIQEGVCKSNLAITGLAYDHTGRFLFVSSLEPGVAIVSMERGGAPEQKISTSVGVRTIALTADSKHIAIVDTDGSVCVHSLAYTAETDGTAHAAHRNMESYNANVVSKKVATETITAGCAVSWYPFPAEQLCLVVPGTGGSAVVLTPHATTSTAADDERRWAEAFVLSTSGPSHRAHDLNLVAFSPNGRYLATADLTGGIVVWAFDATHPGQSAALHAVHPTPNPLHDLAWGRNAVDNYLLATTACDWFEFPDAVAAGARPALMPTASTTASSGTAQVAADFLAAHGAASEPQSEEDALIAAALAAEAQYTAQVASSPAPNANTTAARSPAARSPAGRNPPVRSPVAAKAEAAPKKRLAKKNATAAAPAKDEDDDLFDDDVVSVQGKTVPTGATETVGAGLVEGTSIAAIKLKAGMTTANKRLIDDEALDMGDDDDDDDMDLEQDAGPSGAMDGIMSAAEMAKLAQTGTAVVMAAPARKLQAPFQPSSTKFDEKRRRYLVWNKVGSIVLREETVENRIEIRFSNTGSNRNESFPDRLGFVMAALSHEGAVFASEPEPVEDNKSHRDPELKKEAPGSTIYYHAFAGQKHMAGANETFRWTLSDGEAALAVAVGLGWVAVASSANLLYVFNSAGLPCLTVALRGPVLALSGCDEMLAVVYHNASLQCDLYEVVFQAGCRVRKVVSAVPLPLPRQAVPPEGASSTAQKTTPAEPQQHVEWIGFDVDHHVFTVVDGQGMLWGLLNCADWQWVPLLDIHQVRKSIEHTYWPTCVRNGKLVYVLLNGESRPAVHPQPVVATRALRMPLPAVKDGKDVGEVQRERMHNIVWTNAMTVHTEAALAAATAATSAGKIVAEDPAVLAEKHSQLEYDADKAVLTALQEACQRQRIPTALSLALQIRLEKTLLAAITIANHFGRTVVAEALDAILQHKQEVAAQQQQEQEQLQYAPSAGTYPATTQDFGYSASEFAPEEENLFTENAPTFDDFSPAVPTAPARAGDRRVNFAEATDSTSTGTGGTLSSKVSAKPLMSMFGAHLAKAPVVSPAAPAAAEPTEKAAVRNPFAVVSSGSTPQKRKNVFDGIQDMKASPSPKKPTLNRQSSFSQQARQQRLSDKRIL